MKFLFTNNPPIIHYGLANGLIQIGHEAQILTLWYLPLTEQRSALQKKVDEFKPDFIFTEGDTPNFDRGAVLDICARLGIPLIYWAVQDPVWFKEISFYCAKHADYVFTNTIELLEVYRGLGKKADLLLFGCDPPFHRRVAAVDAYRHDVIFVGANYERRHEAARYMVQPLIDAGFDLMLWGQWWPDEDKPFHVPARYHGGYLPYDQLPAAYASAKIVLGLHLDDTSITQTSVRTYEVLGCGAFYLTQYTKAHANLFQRGVHLEWAADGEEVVRLVRYYLDHDEEREKIALAGQEEVYRHHTVAQRARRMIDLLKSG
ncbi:MAG: glycosyltransferase [Patescibacteria group bacterium]